MNERSSERLFLHKSGLSSWRQCPRKFIHMYVKQQQQMTVDDNEGMNAGSDLHHAARQFEYIYDTDVLFSLPTYLDRLKYLATCIPKGIDSQVYDWMQNIADFEARRSLTWKLDRGMFKPPYQELYLESQEFDYAGTFDRLDHYDETSYIVNDYKPRIYNISQLRQEQAIYWVLINDQMKLDKPVNYWGVIAYDTGVYHCEEFKKATFTALKKNSMKFWEIYRQYESSNDITLFPMKPGEHCDWCGYLNVCWSDPEYSELVLHGKESTEGDEHETS